MMIDMYFKRFLINVFFKGAEYHGTELFLLDSSKGQSEATWSIYVFELQLADWSLQLVKQNYAK